MKYIENLLPVFRTYQICGFAPFSIPFDSKQIWHDGSSDKNRRKWTIYNVVLLVTLLFLVILNFVYHELHIRDENSTMLSYLSFLMFSAMRLLAVFIVIESLWARNEQMQLLVLLQTVDTILNKKLDIPIEYKSMRRIGIFWMIFWLIKITILQTLIFIILLNQNKNIGLVLLSLWYTVPLFISSIRYLQVTHYIDLIGYRFKAISGYIKEVCEKLPELNSKDAFLKHDNDSMENSDLYDQVVLLRKAYHHLWETTNFMNSAFRWSLLLSIGCSFVIILVNSYRSLVWLLTADAKKSRSILVFFTWTIYHSLYFIKLSGSCYRVLRKVRLS